MTPFDLPPKKKGTHNVRFENVRSIVIVGANGSGKSRMGAKIEQMAGVSAHRVTAQRALNIPAYVQPRAYEQAECTLLYGNYNPGQNPEQRAASKFGHRWGDEPASRMLGDFEHVLALLFADEAKRNREYSRAALKTLPTDKPPKCKLDALSEIWLAVMPQRTLTIFDDKIDAHTPSGQKYEARQMSDGERVTVYLMGQALCAPANASSSSTSPRSTSTGPFRAYSGTRSRRRGPTAPSSTSRTTSTSRPRARVPGRSG